MLKVNIPINPFKGIQNGIIMASKRELKGDIKAVIYDLVEEAYSFMLYHPEVEEEKVETIIDDAAELMDTLLNRINNTPPVKSKKDIKEHFNLIKTELQQELYALQVRVNQLAA
jgi:hypothetical protein